MRRRNPPFLLLPLVGEAGGGAPETAAVGIPPTPTPPRKGEGKYHRGRRCRRCASRGRCRRAHRRREHGRHARRAARQAGRALGAREGDPRPPADARRASPRLGRHAGVHAAPARAAREERGRAARSSWSREFEPKGDQPTAIAELVRGVNDNERMQVLLGVTGSGKTFTMAQVIAATQRPALILAPNKTLAAQLYGEIQELLSGERGRVLRLLLRLLPAGGLRPAHRHLHREGSRRSTSRSTACATPRRARCSSATT